MPPKVKINNKMSTSNCYRNIDSSDLSKSWWTQLRKECTRGWPERFKALRTVCSSPRGRWSFDQSGLGHSEQFAVLPGRDGCLARVVKGLQNSLQFLQGEVDVWPERSKVFRTVCSYPRERWMSWKSSKITKHISPREMTSALSINHYYS